MSAHTIKGRLYAQAHLRRTGDLLKSKTLNLPLGFAKASPNIFGDEFTAHIHGGAAPAGPELIASIADLDGSVATLDESHLDKQPDWTFDERWSGKSPADRLANVYKPPPR